METSEMKYLKSGSAWYVFASGPWGVLSPGNLHLEMFTKHPGEKFTLKTFSGVFFEGYGKKPKQEILTMEGLEDKICHFPMGEIWSREPWKEGGLLQPLQLRPGGLRVLRPWRLCPKGACVFFLFLHARGLWFLPFYLIKLWGPYK